MTLSDIPVSIIVVYRVGYGSDVRVAGFSNAGGVDGVEALIFYFNDTKCVPVK
jgi:hypothetical protein